jgi:hypothetical protein
MKHYRWTGAKLKWIADNIHLTDDEMAQHLGTKASVVLCARRRHGLRKPNGGQLTPLLRKRKQECELRTSSMKIAATAEEVEKAKRDAFVQGISLNEHIRRLINTFQTHTNEQERNQALPMDYGTPTVHHAEPERSDERGACEADWMQVHHASRV